eukprot:CAMPEP_0172568740 /NCGR_PEP_ID=MMETSP1067-20121228/120956_1 /TAXON_ID=265564 ORGANISM="Thalassiosira punctigera, Strain Tpunct2005C2" /NCGR_SAMPLE_ID=MMETSP1067 /ASSEMBLY_ACC=CAM_ASM_000444 /LENGTH=89 /DNA_ID=CAMNT_0013360415 /DNA_START=11 /DNA_END=276 /DNA_ORIENTATION=-
MSSSTVLPSSINRNFFMSLPSSLSPSDSDKSGGGGRMEESIDDERSLSFSSSSGAASKFSYLDLPLADENDNVNSATAPVITLDSKVIT